MSARLALFVGGPYHGEIRDPGPASAVVYLDDDAPSGRALYGLQRHVVGDGILEVFVAPDVTRSELGAAVFDLVVAESVRPAFRRVAPDPRDERVAQ